MKRLLTKIKGEFHQNHPLAIYTSWQIGGPAEYFYHPTDLSDLATFLKNWKLEPVVLLGAGTNVLIRDGGIKGVVIYLRGSLNELSGLDDFTIRAEAGVSCSRLVQQCVHLNFIDAAFLAGIPGTIGGALAMNAGAFGDTIWNHVIAVETINRKGEIKNRAATEFTPSYRKVVGLAQDEWFVAGHLQFASDNEAEAQKRVREIIQKRQETQPINQASCGSVFRNPPNDYAARLIENCGLKGMQVGGAKISEKHANFIINEGDAKATDVEKLLQIIIATVEQKHNIILQPEVLILGEK